jgi:hypothetical protein
LLIEADQKLNTDRRSPMPLNKAGNVALPMLFVLGEPQGASGQGSARLRQEGVPSRCPVPPMRRHFPRWASMPNVIEPLGKVAKAIGHLNVIPDVDGAIRTEPWCFPISTRPFRRFRYWSPRAATT